MKNLKKRFTVDPHRKLRMTSNKEKLIKKIMNEFRDRDSVMGSNIAPIATQSSPTQDYVNQEH